MSATQVSAETRRIVAGRSGGWCEVGLPGCAGRAGELSHRRPKGMGGTSVKQRHGPAWLLHSCRGCHQGRTGIESDRNRARELGWLLGPGEDAATVPAWLRTAYGTGWWMLDAEGTYTAVCDIPLPLRPQR